MSKTLKDGTIILLNKDSNGKFNFVSFGAKSNEEKLKDENSIKLKTVTFNGIGDEQGNIIGFECIDNDTIDKVYLKKKDISNRFEVISSGKDDLAKATKLDDETFSYTATISINITSDNNMLTRQEVLDEILKTDSSELAEEIRNKIKLKNII